MGLGIPKDQIYKLTEIAYRVIKHEGLSKPSEIRFRNPISGVRKTMGVCTKIKNEYGDEYNIIISTIKAKFFPNINGKFICNKTGQKLRKAEIGENLSLKEIKDTLAHEIAHLKFWNHSASHKNYTEHILTQINKWWY